LSLLRTKRSSLPSRRSEAEPLADEDACRTVRPPPLHVLHPPQALALERRVADGEHLVDDQHLRLEVGGDGEREPQVHAARVVLDRRVDEALDLGEGDDLVELAHDLVALHAEHGAVQKDVLASAQLRVEAGADLEQRADAAADARVAGRRLGDAREQLQQRALACAVAADDADGLAARDLEGRRAAPRRSRPARLRPRRATRRAARVRPATIASRSIVSRRVGARRYRLPRPSAG
jgi:hypothetical protein